jgi:hypothetical protein
VNVGVLIRGTAATPNAGLQLSNATSTAEFGLAGGAGNWSGNALTGDAVLRAAANQRLILHALGVGGAATLVVSNSNVGVSTILPRAGLQTNAQTIGIPALDVSGQVYGRLPVHVYTTADALNFNTNFALYSNTYIYLTNTAFSAVTLPTTTTTASGGTFFQLKNSTPAYLSVTITNTLGLVSPVSIAPSNAITFVISPSTADRMLLF